MLIGLHFQRCADYDQGRCNEAPRCLGTVLGTVVSLGKGVVEHRAYVQETWERLVESGDDGMGAVKGAVGAESVRAGGKRKRSSEVDEGGDFVIESDESELDEGRAALDLVLAGRKKSRK
jgi:hypothetical protein